MNLKKSVPLKSDRLGLDHQINPSHFMARPSNFRKAAWRRLGKQVAHLLHKPIDWTMLVSTRPLKAIQVFSQRCASHSTKALGGAHLSRMQWLMNHIFLPRLNIQFAALMVNALVEMSPNSDWSSFRSRDVSAVEDVLIKHLLEHFPHAREVILHANTHAFPLFLWGVCVGHVWLVRVLLDYLESATFSTCGGRFMDLGSRQLRITMRNDMFNAALQIATTNGHVAIVYLLLDLSKECGVEPSMNHNQALMSAVEHGHTEVVRALLDEPPHRGVEPCVQALVTAAQNGDQATVEVLLDDFIKDLFAPTYFPARLHFNACRTVKGIKEAAQVAFRRGHALCGHICRFALLWTDCRAHQCLHCMHSN